MFKIVNYIKEKFYIDNKRTTKIVKNIFYSFFIKGGSVVISLVLVRVVLYLINTVQYGIWLTLSSIILWLTVFDVGIANGLRNKLTESLASKDFEKSKNLIATTYTIISLISLFFFLFSFFIIPLIDWYKLLNISISDEKNIQDIIFVIVLSFCFQLIVQTINVILTASHQIAKSSFISFIGQVFILAILLLFAKNFSGNLLMITMVFMFVPIIVMLFFTVYFFNKEFKYIKPNFRNVKAIYIKEIFGVGGTFFLIQIGALVLFQTDNIIIIKLLGANDVTKYNIVFKMFSLITIIFSIIINPYWSAFTEAYFKNDFEWINKELKFIKKIYFILFFLTILLSIFSNEIIGLWIGNKTEIDTNIIIAMALYIVVYMWQTIYVFFLNGIGKIKLQLILVLISAIVNIPLAVFLGKKYGLPGIISANTIVFVVMSLMFYIQTKKILTNKATGIFNK